MGNTPPSTLTHQISVWVLKDKVCKFGLYLLQKWRTRWFVLRSGELPGQYVLEYYTDHTRRKLKGTIDLDQCDQVSWALQHLGVMDGKLNFVV